LHQNSAALAIKTFIKAPLFFFYVGMKQQNSIFGTKTPGFTLGLKNQRQVILLMQFLSIIIREIHVKYLFQLIFLLVFIT